MEFLVWHAALDGCSLHGDPHHSPPLPRHCHCALQSDNTWLGLVAHLYISATSILITLAAFLLRGLLLLPLYLAFATINFLLWLCNCNKTVVNQIVTTAAASLDLQV